MARRILLCDDEIHILRALEFKLQAAGLEVETTSDGEEAWEAILKRKPDLLIADYIMPRLDGMELIRRIRKHPPTADLPVFMLTCKAHLLLSKDLEELHVLQVIAKPFSPHELLQDVNTALTEFAGEA